MEEHNEVKHFKSIFISDIHLGANNIEAEKLSSFLWHHTCENLFLVGDIVDGYSMSRRFYWPKEHSLVLKRIIEKQEQNTNIHYILGNRDSFLKEYEDIIFEGINIKDSMIYTGINGKKYLITHGDTYDGVYTLAAKRYNSTLTKSFRAMRKIFGNRTWSLSEHVENNLKRLNMLSTKFEKAWAEHCKAEGYDGVICGHIHVPNILEIGEPKIHYMNCGDWVSSCTALTENPFGEFKLVTWPYKD